MKNLFCTFILLINVLLLTQTACNTEGVKLTRDDRIAIDTLSQRAIINVTAEVNKYCLDSANTIRQRLVDSLLIVRQQEVVQQRVN